MTPRSEMPHRNQPEALVQSVEQLATAIEAAIETLTFDHAVALSLIEGLRSEATIEAIANSNNMATVRERMTDSLVELEAARGRARAELFRALLREGRSIGQIARLWGISRQLASRIVREHDGGAVTSGVATAEQYCSDNERQEGPATKDGETPPR